MNSVVCAFLLAALIAVVSASPTVSDERKPLDCPKNERYFKCSLEECYTKCEHLKAHPACPQLAPGCFMPACLCVEGYLRNAEGVCVPEYKCPQ